MKVTELLNLLDKKYDHQNDAPHELILFHDYSGAIKNASDREIIDFCSYDDMQEKLNELYENIKEKEYIKFEL